MKLRDLLLGGALLASGLGEINQAQAQSTAFAYQGQLCSSNQPVSGVFDFRFAVRDSAEGSATLLTEPIDRLSTPVSNGVFLVTLDFGEAPFDGSPRWLEISVRPAGEMKFVPLTPAQAIGTSPHAIMANKVVSGGLSAGTYSASVRLENTNNYVAGSFAGEGANLRNLTYESLSTEARASITNTALTAAASVTRQLQSSQIAGHGTAPSFQATDPDAVSSFFGPISILASNNASGQSSLYILQTNFNGPPSLFLEGDYRDGLGGERYRTVFTPGNPGMWSNGYIVLDGGSNSPPFHNPCMLGIFTDVPAGIELVNHYDLTNAYQIEASGPALEGRYPKVFSISSQGQMALINPYGERYPYPQLLITDQTATTNDTFALRSRGGALTIESYETGPQTGTPILTVRDGQMGLGTTNPVATLDVHGSIYAASNIAPFTMASGTNSFVTNANNRSQIVLQIAFNLTPLGTPSCSITSTNVLSTNTYVAAPFPPGLSLTAWVTNLYTLPVQTNAVIRIADTSKNGSSVRLVRYDLFGE